MRTIRKETIRALLKQDSIPLFGQLAAEDLADIWELGHDNNRNHKRTWYASLKVLREALEAKADVYWPGWREGAPRYNTPGQPVSKEATQAWLVCAIWVRDRMKDITDLAELNYRAENAETVEEAQ